MWDWIVIGVAAYALVLAMVLGALRSATETDHRDRAVFDAHLRAGERRPHAA